jgi:hypothetical protein
MENSTIFFLTKGEYIPDSRSHLGLKHAIEIPITNCQAKLSEQVYFEVMISNRGSAKWLHKNIQDIGVVKLGIHLYDSNRKLINLDYFRSTFEREILPNQRITKTVSLSFTEKGVYYLAVDLVSEHICWFENAGSEPQYITVKVT